VGLPEEWPKVPAEKVAHAAKVASRRLPVKVASGKEVRVPEARPDLKAACASVVAAKAVRVAEIHTITTMIRDRSI